VGNDQAGVNIERQWQISLSTEAALKGQVDELKRTMDTAATPQR
jgi:hypothetical protein